MATSGGGPMRAAHELICRLQAAGNDIAGVEAALAAARALPCEVVSTSGLYQAIGQLALLPERDASTKQALLHARRTWRLGAHGAGPAPPAAGPVQDSPPSRHGNGSDASPCKAEGMPFQGRVKAGWERGGRRMGLAVAHSPPELRGREIFFHAGQVDGAASLFDGSEVQGCCVPGGRSGHRVAGRLQCSGQPGQPQEVDKRSQPWQREVQAVAAPGADAARGVGWQTGSAPIPNPGPVASSLPVPHAGDAAEELDERWFAQISTHIVGIAHHEGKLGDGEEVMFEGKVVKNAAGTQVGWLPKEISPYLLPMINRRGGCMHVEGVVPRGAKNKFKVPLDIQVFGQGSDAAAIKELLDEVEKATPQFAALSLIRAPVEGGIRVLELRGHQWEKGAKRPNLAQIMGDRRGGAANAAQALDADMSRIFAAQLPYEDSPEAECPVGFRGELLQHQRKALHWMAMREEHLTAEDAHRRGLPCFWEREAGGGCPRYRNRITGTSVARPPALPRGGILADDMGMGKTAMVIAQLLACPGLTLIVAPLSVLAAWKDQLQSFAPGLTVRVHRGSTKIDGASSLSQRDVVLTTYQTLAQGDLEAVSWFRVVLDEAHEVRNPRTQQAKACAGLKAEVRWCVTGTPLFNGLGDLFGLISFLRVQPFSEHKWWLRTIGRPIRAGNTKGFDRLAQLLGTFLLRRTKNLKVKGADGSLRPVLSLPAKRERIEKVQLGPKELSLYEKLYSLAAEKVQGLEAGGQAQGQAAHVLALLTHLRQLCCSAGLLPRRLLSSLQAEGRGELEQALARLDEQHQGRLLRQVKEAEQEGEEECPICMEPLLSLDPCATACAHLFHRSCLLDWLGTQQHCPTCRQPCSAEDTLDLPAAGSGALQEAAAAAMGADAPDSAKLAWAEDFIVRRSADCKVVVFSQFVRLLNALSGRLEAQGLQPLRLQGDVTAEARAEAVRNFQATHGPRVMLCSVRCAGMGVTLTRASAVLLIDPWWNRAMEEQAVDRVHRIGQDQEVEVVRLVAADTVEEKMLAMQDVKQEVSKSALGGASKGEGEHRRARLDVMLGIFRGPWATRGKHAAGGGKAPAAKRRKKSEASAGAA